MLFPQGAFVSQMEKKGTVPRESSPCHSAVTHNCIPRPSERESVMLVDEQV